jgi:hypothetical protein
MAKKKQDVKVEENPLITLCDELSKQGDLSIAWDGGNDSGCYYLKLNGIDISPDWQPTDPIEMMKEKLINHIADSMEYGSFAGDFYTNGEIAYDPKTKTFSGDDNYSETEQAWILFNFSTVIPDTIWFDSVEVEIIGGAEGQIDSVNVSLRVLNGPKIDEHDTVTEKIEKELEAKLDAVFENYGNLDAIDSVSHHEVYNKNICSKVDGGLKLSIKDLTVSMRQDDEKPVEIQLF